jgi:BirA family biotin operon repressor/biotin-[acetyl-CoA-carboxylase] ligase
VTPVTAGAGTDPDDDVLRSRRPIDPSAVAALLAAPGSWRISHVLRTGSTNADLAAGGHPHGTVLTTEEQLAGRGRSGRDWSCPFGAGLMFSVLLRLPQVPAERRGWTGAVLGLAIVSAMRRVGGVRADLKWPNDVLIDGRKCAGILGEVADGAVVIGAGINVSLRPAELPRADATSMLLAGGAVDREQLLASVLDEFGLLLGRWTAAAGDIDTSGLRSDYRNACGTIGARVRLQLPGGGQVGGRAVDVAVDGSLVIADAFGARSSYSAADVVHLRPDG